MSWDDDEDEEPESSGTTVPCPHCGADVYDDAEQCPSCRMYLSVEDSPREGWPVWMWIGVILAVIVCIGLSGMLLIPRLFR